MDMGELFTQFANIFNERGTMNTVVWFSVLMLCCVILALSWRRELAAPAIAAAVCFFVSFSGLSLGIQALIFAALTVGILFALKRRRGTESEAHTEPETGAEEETDEETLKESGSTENG